MLCEKNIMDILDICVNDRQREREKNLMITDDRHSHMVLFTLFFCVSFTGTKKNVLKFSK